MTAVTDVRIHIANYLDDAARAVHHYGLSTGSPFNAEPGTHVDLASITDGTPITVSPIGAIVMAHHSRGDYSWSVPADWNNGDYSSRYPALAVFAKFLYLGGNYSTPMTTAEVIETWMQEPGRTEEEVMDWLRAAAIAVRNSGPDSALLSAVA